MSRVWNGIPTPSQFNGTFKDNSRKFIIKLWRIFRRPSKPLGKRIKTTGSGNTHV